MKEVKVILFLFLILKTSIGLSIDLPFATNCCSSTEVEWSCADVEHDDEEEKGHCDSNVCDCLCCGHVFVESKVSMIPYEAHDLYVAKSFSYTCNYFHQAQALIWHPPKLIQ